VEPDFEPVVGEPNVSMTIEEICQYTDDGYQVGWEYILTTPAWAEKKLSRGFEVLHDRVLGMTGETFILVGRETDNGDAKVEREVKKYGRLVSESDLGE
jgi:hypothetical protein